MQAQDIVGLSLVAGLVTFLVGAVAWRLEYETPMLQALRLIHRDRRRRAWIHLWMIPAMFVTAGGVGGHAALSGQRSAAVLSLMASFVYAMGAVCWVGSLAFRLTVVPWAAEHLVEHGGPPPGFVALDRWAGCLYLIHMASAYAAFMLIGSATLLDGELPPWIGWLGIGWGVSFLAGFVATRFSGPFNPPFWAHTYTCVVGVALLVT
ncbi:MAG TPA: hypothetical protein VK891_07450 [Euzebyales bacterium]|nr:hypothetical protein [Euzebyales bacterium]